MRRYRYGLGVFLASAILIACSSGGGTESPAATPPDGGASSPSAPAGGGDSTDALRLPDEDAIQGVFGADARVSPQDVESPGTLGSACSGDTVAVTGEQSAIVITPAGGLLAVLYSFGSAGDAAEYFDSFANGSVGCLWTGPDIDTTTSLDVLAGLDDLGGARRVEVATTLTITVNGQSNASQTSYVLMQRGPTVAKLQAAVAASMDAMAGTFDQVGLLAAA